MAGARLDDFDKVRAIMDPGLVAIVEQGFQITGRRGAGADRPGHVCGGVGTLMPDYDLLLTPTLPCTAFPVGQNQPGTINGGKTSYLSWTAFTYPFNLNGLPAATVPCGFTSDGLPVGLQIVGRLHDDATVLRAAAAFEQAKPGRISNQNAIR